MLQFHKALRSKPPRDHGSGLPARPTQQGNHVSDYIDTDFVGGDSPPPALKLPGHRYRVIRKLGSGSMGEVYLAEDTKLHRRVAIKSIRADRTAAGQILRRIKRECLLHARIGAHPHIVTLFDLHDEGDQLHLVMEYVDGDTLDHILDTHKKQGKQFPIADGVDIAIQCLEGLAHVHARGIIHRDIKPANVILTRDNAGRYTAKIMDFGVARQEEQDPEVTTLTQPGGRSPGTPLYMAPEQIDSATYGPVVPASDLYAVGVLLYQLIAGHPPFTGSLTDVFNGHLNLDPRPIVRPSGATPHPLLAEAIDKALEKHAHRRFASAADFATELKSIRALVNAGGVTEDSEEEDSLLATAWHGSVTRWAIAGLAGLAIAAVAFVGIPSAHLQLALNMLDGVISSPSTPGPGVSIPVDESDSATADTAEAAEGEEPDPGLDIRPDAKIPQSAAPPKATPKPEPQKPAAPAPAPVTKAPETVATAPVVQAPVVEAPATSTTPPEPVVDTPAPAEAALPVPEIIPPTPDPVMEEAPIADGGVQSLPGLESIDLQDPYQLNPDLEPDATLEVAEVPMVVEADDVVSLEEAAAHPLDEEVGLEPIVVAQAESTPKPPAAPDKTYTVQPGDTLDIIARRYNLSVSDLARWNLLRNPNDLRAEQVLYLYERPNLPPMSEPSSALDMGKRESKSKEILRKTRERVKGWID